MLFLSCTLATLFQRELNPHILTPTMAAQIASDFAEIKLIKERPAFHSTKEAWNGKFRDGRWQMEYGSGHITGWHVTVSFKADASDRKVESFGYSVE